jgi:hypothetical protein
MFLDEMPKNGQFVRLWHANGEIWSDVMKWDGGTLMIYNKEADEFEDARGIFLDVKVIKYLTSV